MIVLAADAALAVANSPVGHHKIQKMKYFLSKSQGGSSLGKKKMRKWLFE